METRISIMIWLGHIDCSGSLHRAAKKRSQHTGLWLFEETSFHSWVQSPDNAQQLHILWIYGAPGAGKTVLSATAIDHLRTQECAHGEKASKVVYFYGDSTDTSTGTAFNLCIAMLSQLIGGLSDIPPIITERYANARRHGRCKISEDDEPLRLLRHVIADLPSVIVVVDALDECKDTSEVVSWLEEAVHSLPQLRVLCFSRDVAAVRRRLGQQLTIRMDAGLIRSDVEKYLVSAVSTLPGESADLKSRVIETISRKVEGIFLFAELSIGTLRSAIDVDDMMKILDTIPTGINEMYELILRRLSKDSYARQSLAQKVFRLMCASFRPMTWSEMRYALSWNPNLQEFEKTKEPFKEAIFELCCPLIEYRVEMDTFLLIHFSLYEYLSGCPPKPALTQDITGFFVEESHAQHELAEITLACMLDENVCRSTSVHIDYNPLVLYATQNWCRHLSNSPFDRALYTRYTDFATCSQRRSTWVLRWLLIDEWSFPLHQIVNLQKSVQGWAGKGDGNQLSMKDILGDLQTALFGLDEIQAALPSSGASTKSRAISNFERLVCVRNLAREYTMAGELDDGVSMFELAIQKVEASNGTLAPRSCWLLNSLGILYDQQGRTSLAEETQCRALTIQEMSLAPNHLDIVLTINELGRIARHLERFEDSERLHHRALQILEETFSNDDLHVTWTKCALGRSLLKQGRPDEAIHLHHQVLDVESARLGRNHPHTLWTLSDIARCHRAQGKISDAIATQQEVMERSEEALGTENPDALWAANSLGIMHELAGRLDVAKSLHTKALEGQIRSLGRDHVHTQWSQKRLEALHGAM